MYFSKHVLEGSFENKMLVLREICREDYLSGKKLFFYAGEEINCG